MPNFRSTFLAAAALLLLSGCGLFRSGVKEQAQPVQPAVDREFRGAWVATVSNIDWPSAPGLTTEQQQREARAILDTAVSLGLNAIIFQVRPHCDAMYQSALEPWSYYLTGTEGKAPEPFYDPLAFWVEEAHNRGLELHAWFNPYRAHLPRGGEIGDSSIIRKMPGLAKQIPGGTWWLDPGNPRVQEHSVSVVMDVVRRYDVDGIHFDDYFYPYGDGNFPDDDSWNAYVAAGGSLSRQDWRRSNVNTFIERLYTQIKKEKPYVKLGISPFGIWRPNNPPSISGFDQYNGLYADAKLWLNKGWVDYFTPQLYWPINQIPQSFPVLLGWWTRENPAHRYIWPGMFTGRMTSETGIDELLNQIMIARGFVPEGPGHVHFSFKSFLRDSTGLDSTLENTVYRRPAIVPSSPWLDDEAPAAPGVTSTQDTAAVRLAWSHANPSDVFRWILYTRYAGGWTANIFNRNDRIAAIPLTRTFDERIRRRRQTDSVAVRSESLTRIAVSCVDRTGNESEKVFVDVVVPPAPAAKKEGEPATPTP